MRHTVIIVAAGSGRRFGSDLPKQFCLLGGRPVLMTTIEALRECLPQASIILVLNDDYLQYWSNICAEYGFVSPPVVGGGATRWHSVKNAIDFIKNNDSDALGEGHIISVHDGARPIVRNDMIRRLLDVLTKESECCGVVPVVSVTDSLRMVCADGTSKPVDRSLFKAVQTPQSFHARALVDAYNMPRQDTFTDDASVVEAKFGINCIAMSLGDPENIKITNPRDLEIAKLYLSQK